MPDRPLVRRRTAVTGALGLAALAASGCDTGDDLPAPDGTQPASGSASPSATEPTESTEQQQTPDEVLVDHVLSDLGIALGVVAGARQVPRLRRSVAPLLKAHRRHIEALDGELPDTGAPQPADLPTLVRSERRLHARLVDAASRAESGALAKLLASMSASVTQHLLALAQEPTG